MREKNGALTFSERLMYSLREMYSLRGYLPFRMSKFEEYDLYMKNRDFLVGENIISFTDTDGALLALKPDVTLSIIKNAKDAEGVKEKVFYSENVYRTSGSTRKFKEIMQMGLECIGDLDGFDVCEAVELAAASLSEIDSGFVLDLSHMGLVAALLDLAELDAVSEGELLSFISGKNVHEAARALEKCNTPPEIRDKILTLITLRVPLSEAVEALRPLAVGEGGEAALREIALLARALGERYSERVYFDASVMNDMTYYNGIVFRGFIPGVSEGVLAGGRYDALMRRMGKSSEALGFAIYFDLLEGLDGEDDGYDVDVLLIYDEKLDTGRVIERARELTHDGYSVSCQRAVPEGLRYRRIERLEA